MALITIGSLRAARGGIWKVRSRMVNATWVQAAGTVLLGLVGLWLAHSYRRQLGLKLAERQVDALTSLWTVVAAASPWRSTPLDAAARQRIQDGMCRWYFDEGNGIFLSTAARDLFIVVQSNLICPVDQIQPPALAAELGSLSESDADRRRGCVCIRQVSLLRHQMKTDLNLHADLPYYTGVRPSDRDFLRSCGLSPWRRPWRGYPRRPAARLRFRRRNVRRDLCVCGLC